MNRAIRAELLKFRTTRMWWGMAIPILLLAGAMAALFALLVAGHPLQDTGIRAPDLDDPQMVSTVYSAGLGMSRMLVMAVGIMSMGAEVRHRTVTSTFLATPRRGRVMGAKTIAMLVIGAAYAVVHLVGAVGVGATITAVRGFNPFPPEALRTMVLSLLVLGLWGLIGLGIGVLIPNQVAALMIGIGTVWIVEPLLTLLLMTQSWGGSVSRFFPGSATSAMVDQVSLDRATSMLEWWQGALVLAAYAAVCTLVGTALTRRRDVT